MKAFFNEIFDYNFQCNKKLIDECLGLSEVSPRTKSLFSHILNAHHIWNARILQKVTDYDVWQEHDIKDWADIHYENSEGRLFTNTLKDMLFHIVNHSTNHRGQIAVEFKSNGVTPVSLDYIHYKR